MATLERQVNLGLLGTRMYHWPGSNPVSDPRAAEEIEDIRLNDVVVWNKLETPAIIARTEVLRTAGPFDLSLHGPEDHDL